MAYSVLLVQRGITAQTHPVAGKSGKLYGNAIASPKDGGVVFKMSQADYEAAADDILGNTAAGQQWVPKIDMNPAFAPQQPQPSAAPRPKCDRCPQPAVARWDRYDYCAEHAPNNAIWFDENEHIQWLAESHPAASGPSVEPDSGPGVVDPNGDLPAEQLPPPFAGSAQEEAAIAESGPGPIVEPGLPPQLRKKPVAETGPSGPPPAEGPSGPPMETGPSGPSGAVQAPPAVANERVEPVAHPQVPQTTEVSEKTASVVGMITDAVIQAVLPRLEEIIDSRIKNSAPSKNGHRRPEPRASAKKKKPKAPPAAPRKKGQAPAPPKGTEFQQLQARARELKINVFGKGTEALKKAIAEAEAGAQ